MQAYLFTVYAIMHVCKYICISTYARKPHAMHNMHVLYNDSASECMVIERLGCTRSVRVRALPEAVTL